MNRAHPDELEPNYPTPCFCSSCMKAGGAARAALREKWLGSTRRMVAHVPAEREPRPRRKRTRRIVYSNGRGKVVAR